MILLTLLLGCPAPAPTLPAGHATKPDIILVSVDTLRADHVGSYGYARDTTPHLDARATAGTRFASAWSPAPWTLPAHVSMLSGVSPLTHGVVESELVLGPDLPLVQEAFSAAGWHTGGVVSSLFVSSRYGLDRGFEHFHDFGIHDPKTNLQATVDAEQVFGEARRWVSTLPAGEPVFLFLHVYDPHYPCAAPGEHGKRFDASTEAVPYRRYSHYLRHPLDPATLQQVTDGYDEEIAYVDHALDQLVTTWEQAGRKAVWTVVSDHGEELGERGSWGHGHTLYPEQLHVPWITWGFPVQAGVIEDRVALEDVPLTLAGLAGVDFTTDQAVDRSPQLLGGENPAGRLPPARIASTSRFKTSRIRYHEPPWDLYLDLRSGEKSLCKLGEDPTCATERLETDPVIADFMEDRLWPMLGTPWTATAPLDLRTDGTVILDGHLRPGAAQVQAEQSFTLFPMDAELRWKQGGPVSAVGSRPESTDPLRYRGPVPAAVRKDLAQDESEALEALGYVQE